MACFHGGASVWVQCFSLSSYVPSSGEQPVHVLLYIYVCIYLHMFHTLMQSRRSVCDCKSQGNPLQRNQKQKYQKNRHRHPRSGIMLERKAVYIAGNLPFVPGSKLLTWSWLPAEAPGPSTLLKMEVNNQQLHYPPRSENPTVGCCTISGSSDATHFDRYGLRPFSGNPYDV